MLQILTTLFFVISAMTNSTLDVELNKDKSEVVSLAKSLLKCKYKYGGKSPKGFDCSGFTKYVYKKSTGIDLASSSSLQYRQGKTIKSSKSQPGDLIFFKRGSKINHVGIVYKNEKKSLWVIHSTTSKGVILEDVKRSSYWRNKIAKIKRLL